MRTRRAALALAAGAVAAVSAGAAGLAAVAQAEPVQQFSFQMGDTTPDGRFTLRFSSRSFDTTGVTPPQMSENWIRLPAGSTLRPEFRKRAFWCDGDQLIDAGSWASPPDVSFYRTLRNLDPSIKVLAKRRTRLDRRYLQILQTCRRARIGWGKAIIDGRPGIADVFPADLVFFAGRPRQPGDAGSISIVGIPQPNSVAVRNNGILRRGRAAVSLRFVNEPSADGRFGYKLVLPIGPVQGFRISVAQVEATITGLAIRKARRELFWFTRPSCPGGRISFEGFYGYDPPLADITKLVELPCPRFER